MSSDDIKKQINSRRQFIINSCAAYGAIGLKSALLGLPPAFLTRRAVAVENPTFLVFSTRQSGDPVNANVPGTYINGIDHVIPSANFALGNVNVTGGQPWANLPAALRQRLHFIHHNSQTNAHPESVNVLRVQNALSAKSGVGPEMLPSAIAQITAQALGTLTDRPALVGNIGSQLTFENVPQGRTSPDGLRDLFGAGEGANAQNMATFRDAQLDALYGDLKANGTPTQKRFFDAHVLGRAQAKQLGEDLGNLLANIDGNSANDQALTAAALIVTRANPVIVMSIPFGGDNHGDAGLAREVREHNSGTAAIATLWNQLTTLGMADSTTFALQNVFGRTLRQNDRGGRDHNGAHSIMALFGPKVQGGVSGRVQTVDNRRGGISTAINSVDGSSNNTDIPVSETLASAAKTLMAACGAEQAELDRVAIGKVITNALND